jgi:uncharacterized protein (TIGR02452 family)
MDLRQLARETLSILDQGRYVAPSGRTVTLDLARCVEGTRLWTPDALALLVAAQEAAGGGGSPPRLEVTGETTAAAARRLAAEGPVLLLNFASAVSVGGGFLRGARAQEEDLCRGSALWVCLEPQRDYYGANRTAGTDLYTDHMIVSPDVPFFRDDARELLEAPWTASVVTAPAPCAIELDPAERAQLPAVFARRVACLLALAAALGHRRLVLGAWGCGAFENDPALVADAFARRLEQLGGAAGFEQVVFAVWDRSPEQRNLGAFRARLLG